jgi:hypothetical protein
LKKFRFLGIRQVGLRRSLRQVELGDTDKGPGSGIERWQKVELKKERRVWRRKGLKRRAVVDLEEVHLFLDRHDGATYPSACVSTDGSYLPWSSFPEELHDWFDQIWADLDQIRHKSRYD